MLQDLVFSVRGSRREKAVDDWNILMTGARMPGRGDRIYAKAKPSEICVMWKSSKQNKHTFQTNAGFFVSSSKFALSILSLRHPHKNVVENI